MKKILKISHSYKIRSRTTFNSMNEQKLEKLNSWKTTYEYKPGQVIFYEGNPALAIYCIHSGMVRLFKAGYLGAESAIRLLGRGEISHSGLYRPMSPSPPGRRLSAMPGFVSFLERVF